MRRLDALAGDQQGYYFPVRASAGKLTKNAHADPGFINHALQYMPPVDMSCHGWRRGFASHGQRELGFLLSDVKLILGCAVRRRYRLQLRARPDDREKTRDDGKMDCVA